MQIYVWLTVSKRYRKKGMRIMAFVLMKDNPLSRAKSCKLQILPWWIDGTFTTSTVLERSSWFHFRDIIKKLHLQVRTSKNVNSGLMYSAHHLKLQSWVVDLIFGITSLSLIFSDFC